mmetsp:Transcript_2582/g.7051  ORF Transcript_2582/g.7051 Transcript_2582/m.7051 type:complete len:87 (+) Transcript_2582:186-446(+)
MGKETLHQSTCLLRCHKSEVKYQNSNSTAPIASASTRSSGTVTVFRPSLRTNIPTHTRRLSLTKEINSTGSPAATTSSNKQQQQEQ